MKAHTLLKTYLNTITELTDLVADRIYWPQAPNAISKSCVVISYITVDRIHSLDYVRPLMQVSAFSRDPEEAIQIAEVIVNHLKNYKGMMDTYFVVSVFQEERFFADNTWWHVPIRIELKYQEG